MQLSSEESWLGGFAEKTGFAITEATPERVVLEWDVGPEHHQPYGIVHGGVYCSAIETAASIAGAVWLGERGQVVGVNNNTDFLRAVTEGRLLATATPLHRGRSQQLWQVAITDEQDRVVAHGQVRLQNLTKS
jgi:1,4-dihydroxy-2-naphthoyl-CoA hydrolase